MTGTENGTLCVDGSASHDGGSVGVWSRPLYVSVCVYPAVSDDSFTPRCVFIHNVCHASLIPKYEWLPAFDDSRRTPN